MDNITIKKADGTTDIVYTATVASTGDLAPARYEQQGPSVLSQRPQFAVQSSKPSGNGDLRRITVNGVYPLIDATTGLEVGRVTLSDCKITFPRAGAAVAVKEATHQLLNLVSSAVVKKAAETGYAPT